MDAPDGFRGDLNNDAGSTVADLPESDWDGSRPQEGS
jgi:hypothetical protein